MVNEKHGKNVTMPYEFLTTVFVLCKEWTENPELHEQYHKMNCCVELLWDMIEKKVDAMQRREEYISKIKSEITADFLSADYENDALTARKGNEV